MKNTLAKSLLRMCDALLNTPSLFILFLILFFSAPLCSQAQTQYKTLHVKFKEASRPVKAISGRTAYSGMARVDQVSEKHKASSIKRIFPDAGIFEEAHKAFGLHLWYEIKLTKVATLKSAIEDYQATDFFDLVEESRPYSFVDDGTNAPAPLPTLPSGSNDPHFPGQWHLENHGQTGGTSGADINLIKAWQKETGSPNVIVAVIDGGINIKHPDLKNALWVNADEIPSNGKDDDHNGYIDDIHGYGFGDQSATIYPHNHGTHVAGTIGAVSNNGVGVSGIAGGNGIESGVRLMSCAGFGFFDIGGFEEAMVYAADNGAVISQNSWGGGSNAIEAAIDYFISRAGYDNSTGNFSKNIQTGPMAGGVVIFSAGNENTSYGYPGSYEKVIAVASTDHNDVKSSFSNYGTWVDISAPGSNVFSTTKTGYGYLSGTSMACPHVSGVAALVVSNLQRTGLKPNEIWNRLRFCSRSISSMNPNLWQQLGWGRLDAFVALKERDEIPPGVIADLVADEIHSTSLLLRWTASGESNTEGQAAEYEIRYSTNPIDVTNFSSATLVPHAPVPPPSGDLVMLELENLSPVTTYYLALKSIDVFNNVSPLSNVVSVKTLRLPTPEIVSTQLSEQLFTGGISTKPVLVKNIGEEDELRIRVGVPQIQSAPVIPALGAKGSLFAINSSRNTIEELNTRTGNIIHSIPMPEPSSKTTEGLAFDGVYLYYGRSEKIYKINAETGEIVRTILLNDAPVIRGLAWSGRYLYVSRYSGGNYGMFEIDVDNGSVLRTLNQCSESAFFGNNNTLLIPGNGRLEEISIETGNFVRGIPGAANPNCVAFSFVDNLIFVSNEYEKLITAIRPGDGTVAYTIPYPITTALAGLEHSFGWLETNEQVITIQAGQTGEVPLTFIATGLNSGTWTGSVNIIPLNSNSNPIPVTVNLTVKSATDIETASEINFGTQYLGSPIDTTITLANRGFSDLVINQIKSNNTKVTSSISTITLLPGQQINMQVSVQPDGEGVIDAHITVTSNDPDEGVMTIPVRASVLKAPAISVHPDSLNAILSSGETAELTLTLTNTGQSNLHWNAYLSGSDSANFMQAAIKQNEFNVQADSVYKNDLGEISLRAASPEPLTCLSYDPNGQLIYAKSFGGNNFYTFDPTVNRWTHIGLTPANCWGQATYLNGKLYHGGSQLNVYTIRSDAWSSIQFPVSGSVASITSDDKYVYVGIEKVLYRFDPVSESWLELAPLPGAFFVIGFSALSYHSGILYVNGVSAVMGDGNTYFFKYFIDSNTWISSNSIAGQVSVGGAIDISSARYFVVGAARNLPDNRIQMSILDIRNGEWSKMSIPFPVGNNSGLAFIGKPGASGMYFIQGETGTNFGYYETASAPNWFTISPSGGNLPAGETQAISVSLNAQALFGGVYRGNVRIYSVHPSIEENVPLELKVFGASDISLDKVSVDFGDVILGYQNGNGVTIKNRGSAELVISNVSISNPDFKASQTSLTIPVGESTTFITSFKPTSIGEQTGTFTFHTNDPLKSEILFELKGIGVHPAQLQVPSDTIKVTLITGEIAEKKISIENTGSGSTQYLTVFGDEQWITFDSAGFALNIDPQQTREFVAKINATGFSNGRYYGSILVIDHRDPSGVSYLIPVQLDVKSATDISLSLDSLDYGNQFVNGQYDSTIRIRNAGVLPLSISSIESDNAEFTISVSGPITLNPGESVNATVRFSPVAIHSQVGRITFASNDPDESFIAIHIKGTGVNPPQLNSSDAALFIEAFANESQTETIDLSNPGGSVLKWKINNEWDPQPSAAGDFTSKADVPLEFGNPLKLTAITADPASGVLYAQCLWYNNQYVYSALTNTWSEVGITPSRTDKAIGGAIILNSKMYCTYTDDRSTIYIYDMVLKDWTTKPKTLDFASANITTDGILLYLAGEGKFASYNPKTNEWINLATPNFTLDGLGGLNYLEGVLYAHSSNSQGFARYNIATAIWEDLIPLPGNVTLGSTVDLTRKRYYAYGENYLYEYDIAANVWTVRFVPLFEIGNDGGISYLSKPGFEGIYFIQGGSEKGFARYEPADDLAWLRSSQLIGEIESMDNQTLGVNCNAVGLNPGVYHGNINVTTNAPTSLTFNIPVTFTVKSPAPTIEIAAMITDTVDRTTEITYYLVIANRGKELLEWNLGNSLPAWLSVNKTSGNISGQSIDSVAVTFHPDMFSGSNVFDYILEINSNDPSVSKSTTRLILTMLITGIDQEFRKSILLASPNPFENKVKIHMEGFESSKITLVLFDLIGRAVWKSHEIEIPSQREIEIDGSHLPSGLYTCILSIDNKLIDSIRLLKN